MTLGEAQRKFVGMLAQLLTWAYANGYELTLGEGYVASHTGHMPNSLHYIKLAQDLNLFKDGVYLSDTESHRPLGEFWESIGGSWGGRFKDGNHYSFGWEGRR